MKRFFQIIGLVSLMSFSFFYTEKIVSIVKEMDVLMVKIKEEKDKYYIEPIDAIIDNNYIIPGLSGREVDIDLSYDIIKKVGKYSSNLLVYKKIKPKISLINNFDKYIISGNKNKKEVTLLFKVKSNDSITNIKNILDKYKIKSTFFVDGDWFSNNNELVISLIKENYNIGNLGYNMDYSNSKFSWMNTIVNKIGNQHITFCYTENDNKVTLNKCMIDKSYTIKPNIIVNTNPLIEVKKNINNGSIISFDINEKVESELPLIIKYIKSRGYNITNLSKFLEE